MAHFFTFDMLFERYGREGRVVTEEDHEELRKNREFYAKVAHEEDIGSDETASPVPLQAPPHDKVQQAPDSAAAATTLNKEMTQLPASNDDDDDEKSLKNLITQETSINLQNVSEQGEDGKHVDAGGVDLGSQAEAGGVIMDLVEGVCSTKDDINANDSVDTPTSKTLGKRPNESGDYADIVEGVGSTKDDINANDLVDTPTSKTLRKRPNESGDYADGGALSATNKIQKLARMEKLD